jgi:ABC-type transport system involved in cytochrome c biogenesis permease component
MKTFILKIMQFFGIVTEMESGKIELNPILKKDLIYKLRDKKVIISINSGMIATAFIFIIYYGLLSQENPREAHGAPIFWIISSLQFIFIYFGVGQMASESISREFEKSTFDSLYLTSLNSKEIFLGKILSSIAPLYLLVFTFLPFIAICMWLGGVSLSFVLANILIITLLSIIAGIIGASCSALFQNSKKAHGMTVLFQIVIPMFLNIAYSIAMIKHPYNRLVWGYVILLGLYFLFSMLLLWALGIYKLKHPGRRKSSKSS